MNVAIRRGELEDAGAIAAMVKDLTDEIVERTGSQYFTIDIETTTCRCRHFLAEGIYTVFLAIDTETHGKIGFISLCESYALYAEGAFGIIQELYVVPTHRSLQVGRQLVAVAQSYGGDRGWKRLEVSTPPLPAFDNTVRFYAQQNFEFSGGRKMKIDLLENSPKLR